MRDVVEDPRVHSEFEVKCISTGEALRVHVDRVEAGSMLLEQVDLLDFESVASCLEFSDGVSSFVLKSEVQLCPTFLKGCRICLMLMRYLLLICPLFIINSMFSF
ncbi:hypothetical protein L1049_015937 [Liquidambar formosana]|uniref:Uncharacterized protein n=1 Tax=Liquidambar formosana TaxID=63359 RepID=A0AAP0X2U2_LIQFO